MMKRILFFILIVLSAVSSFAQDVPFSNKYLFIEGTAENEEILEFFMTNFTMEAGAAGYIVTESKGEASHTMKFSVEPNIVEETEGEQQFEPDLTKFVVKISLLRNTDDFEIITFDFFFTELDELYAYNRELFQNATLYIPPMTEEDLALEREINNRWKNKWLYFRASFDYPITFYLLQSEGLTGNISLYNETKTSFDPLGHEVIAMPGATLGVEVQFLNFMSAELNFQASMGDTRSNLHINMAAGLEIKFPIKFENIVLTPYIASAFFFLPSEIFIDFPPFAVGAGAQLSAKGGSMGAFFIDVKYMFSFTDAIMTNPYLAYPENQQYAPYPAGIHYKRSYIGIGIGYKFGLFDRKSK